MDLTAGGDELGELFLLFAQRDPLLDESQRAERSTHYAEQAVALLRESQEKKDSLTCRKLRQILILSHSERGIAIAV